MYKKIVKYFSAHTMYSGIVHLLIGVGIGILVTYPLIGIHPVKWGLLFLGLGLAGHLYPLWIKK